ncbi:hypothetical protein Tco_0825427 [Tanacetum coccineum]
MLVAAMRMTHCQIALEASIAGTQQRIVELEENLWEHNIQVAAFHIVLTHGQQTFLLNEIPTSAEPQVAVFLILEVNVLSHVPYDYHFIYRQGPNQRPSAPTTKTHGNNVDRHPRHQVSDLRSEPGNQLAVKSRNQNLRFVLTDTSVTLLYTFACVIRSRIASLSQ